MLGTEKKMKYFGATRSATCKDEELEGVLGVSNFRGSVIKCCTFPLQSKAVFLGLH